MINICVYKVLDVNLIKIEWDVTFPVAMLECNGVLLGPLLHPLKLQ